MNITVFDITIVAITVAVLAVLWVRASREPRRHAAAPGLMTSVGILGTFLGTTIALFSAFGNIEELTDQRDNLARFLEGMKVALLTSLLGLSASILFRVLQSPPEAARTPEFEQLQAIKRALRDNGDQSLSRQLADLRDGNRELLVALQGLPEAVRHTLGASVDDLAMKVTSTLVDSVGRARALLDEQIETYHKEYQRLTEEMIAHIEQALIKQFGVRLKEFSESAVAIRQWQTDNRKQVEELTAAFEQAAKGITRIREDCERIPVTMDSFGRLLSAADGALQKCQPQLKEFTDQLKEFTDQLAAMAKMRRDAEATFPALKRHLEGVIETLEKDLAAMLERVPEFVNGEVTRAAQQNAMNLEKTFAQMNTVLQAAGREQEKIVRKAMDSLESADNELDRMLGKCLGTFGRDLEKLTDAIAKGLETVSQGVNR